MRDIKDQKLLALLRPNARMPLAQLATKLSLSRATVVKRIIRMEDEGIIVGYQVQVRPEHTSNLMRAWMSIPVTGNETAKVIASLLGEPGVATLHNTNGRWDLLAE